MRRFLRIGAIVGGAGFLAIQLIRPGISHPAVTAELAAPREVQQILRNACYDCHSNETRLAWFDEIAPAYWLVARDVNQGRARLNFSEIGKLPAGQQKGLLYEAVSQVQLGAMPLPAYTRLHPAAKVTVEALNVIKAYLHPPEVRSAATASDLAADDAEYAAWAAAGKVEGTVAPAPNGISFPAGYANWKTVSATDRLDNHTLRAILGNEVAIRAIAENRTNPWPDGAMLAKVAWLARDNGEGQLHAGAFYQVEFMIRDRHKYATTEGWGWARWRGTKLTPYGAGAGFPEECIGCHRPVRDRDYVFTRPLARTSLSGGLPVNPLEWAVIASSADEKEATMSTLYGNEEAVRYARSHAGREYPVGSELALVTWTGRDDPEWFGGRIPGTVKSVEFVCVVAGEAGESSYAYKRYEGTRLERTRQTEGASDRAREVASIRAAVMPGGK